MASTSARLQRPAPLDPSQAASPASPLAAGSPIPRAGGRSPGKVPRVRLRTRYVRADHVLIVAVREARLPYDVATSSSPRMQSPKAYVHIAVSPDPTPGQTMRFLGGVHEPSETPSWAEDFKLRLQAEPDGSRRLHIGLWDWSGRRGGAGGSPTKGQLGRDDRFLGGLSFAVKELLPPNTTSLDGWFSLLGQQEAAHGHVRLDDASSQDLRGSRGTGSPLLAAARRGAASRSPQTPPVAAKSPLLIDYLSEGADATAAPPHTSPPPLWHVGARCRAVFHGDGMPYDAVVQSMADGDPGSCVVLFTDYDETQTTPLSDLLPGGASSSPLAAPQQADQPPASGGGDVADPVDWDEMTPQELARQESILRLTSAVHEYNDRLGTLLEVFYEPLVFDLTSEEHSNVFGNVSSLKDMAADLASKLEQRLGAEGGRVRVFGDLVEEYATRIRAAYTSYCANKQNAVLTIQQLLKSRDDFVQFLRQAAQEGKGNLNDLLALPSRHIKALQHLAGEVLRNTPQGHEDLRHIMRAKVQLRDLQQHISDQVAKFDQLAKMGFYETHTEGLGDFKLSRPGRAFVREGQMLLGLPKRTLLRKSKTPVLKPCLALLFSDTLLLTEETGHADGSRSFRLLEQPLMLADLKVSEGPELDLFVSMHHSHYILRCTGHREKRYWHGVISNPGALGHGTLLDGRVTPGAAATASRSDQYLLPREVVLTPDPDTGFGLTLREDSLGFFRDIAPGGAADQAQISTLDQLLAVNDVSIEGLTHAGVLELLLASTGPARLLLVKALHRTSLIRDEYDSVGMLLRGVNPVFVRKIVPGGPADKAGLKLGDQLWEVNGTWVRHATQEAVVRAMEGNRRRNVDLLVRSTLRRVVIQRSAAGGYGFNVAQTSETSPIVVQSVRREGPAYLAGLRIGDQIWDVNDVKVRREPLDRVRQIISMVKGELAMVVISTLRDVELVNTPGTPYGLNLQGNCPVVIASVDAQGQAARMGLRAGDAVWAVNDVETIGSRHKEVVDLIRQRSDRVRLSVCLS